MIERYSTIDGLNLPLIEVTQLINMIDIIFTLFNSRISSNPLMKDSIEMIQLETGLSVSIFEAKYKSIKTLITPS
jgi:hypothetical protein